MVETPAQARRVEPATLALGAAALIAVAALGIVLFRSGDTVAETPASEALPSAEAPSLDASIATLQEALRRDPDSHDNWFMLGLALRDSRRFPEAEQAFRRAMELAPRNADYTAYVAEMLLLVGGDNPSPEAEQLLRRTLELDPGNAQARYYLATLKDVRGDHRGAVEELIALLREAPAGASWEPQVRDAVTLIARTNAIDISSRLPPPQASPETATAAIPGPTSEQMDAARGIPPSQQDAMVRGMVERLATRLRQNPRDADGWIRLMRSRMALGDSRAAQAALRSGLAAFAGDGAAAGRLRSAAAELGVPSPG
jgi:cytochrome c-type biogenesis protein CcmH